jgi:hypothetical protein
VEVGAELAALDALPLLPVPPQAAIVSAAAIGVPSVISRFIRCLLLRGITVVHGSHHRRRCLEPEPPDQERAEEDHGGDLCRARGVDSGGVVAGFFEAEQRRVLADQEERECDGGERDPGEREQDQDRAPVPAGDPLDRGEQCESDRRRAEEVEEEERPDGRDRRVEVLELVEMDGPDCQHGERAEQARS